MNEDFKKQATRREFLGTAATIAAATLMPSTLFAQSGAAAPAVSQGQLAADPLRPQFHLLPARNWMNDPNGPIYFNGQYHMFFQYNPHAAVWGDMSWNHAVSPDMIHWKHLPLALTPTPDSADSYGCFSGSAIRVGQRVYQVYTGTRLSSRELATIRDGEDKIQESQCLAYSDDPDLITWTKLPKPVIERPPAALAITGFRDPSAWKQGKWYYMTVGSGVAKQGGCVLLYRSADMKTWEYLHPLTSGTWTGKGTANPCEDGEMWECPDFFPLDGAHVLIYSTLGKVFWQSGVLEEGTMKFQPGRTGELDLGAFYAPKTQLDAHGRRILWGWLQERRPESAMRAAGWSGMMGLPRAMQLDKDGMLRITALPELQQLRDGELANDVTSGATTCVLPQASGEFVAAGTRGSPLSCVVSYGETELVRATYSPETHTFILDSKEIKLEASDAPVLHGFVDGSVLELIVSERIGYTKRFYYDQKTAPGVRVALTSPASGAARLQAWKIKPISDNRLTTPAPSSSQAQSMQPAAVSAFQGARSRASAVTCGPASLYDP